MFNNLFHFVLSTLKKRSVSLFILSAFLSINMVVAVPNLTFAMQRADYRTSLLERGERSEGTQNPRCTSAKRWLTRLYRFSITGAAAIYCFNYTGENYQKYKEVAAVLKDSANLRNSCRDSVAWRAACEAVIPTACGNDDHYSTRVDRSDLYHFVDWKIGDCGQWKEFTDALKKEYVTTSCSYDEDTG